MYTKIVSGGIVVDACDEMRFVKWQEKNRVFLNCEEADADGFIGYGGQEIYLLAGRAEVDGYSVATYTEITREEYEELRAEIDAGKEIPDPDGGDEEPENPAKTRLQALEEQLAQMMETNWMLTECLLEMSEIVYGGEML